jgi:hypothetical protein
MLNMKICTNCNQVKPFEAFYASSTHRSGYASWCKVCESERCKIKNQKNREKRLAVARVYRNANKEKINASIKNWQERNKERYAMYFVKHRENNRAYHNEKWMRRDAAKKQRTPTWLSKNHIKQMQVEYELAKWCTEVTGIPYHVDHIVPLQGKIVSGLHVPWNLQVIPAKTNRSKSNRLLETL